MRNNLPLYSLNCEFQCENDSSSFKGIIYRKGDVLFGSSLEKGIKKSILGRLLFDDDINKLSFITFGLNVESLNFYVFLMEKKNRLLLEGPYNGQNWQYMDPYGLEIETKEEKEFLLELAINPQSKNLVNLLEISRQKNLSDKYLNTNLEHNFLNYFNRSTIAFIEGSLNNEATLELMPVVRNK